MKPFDYVIILFSILLGVCITQMATNIVLVIQHFETAVLYAPPILWNATALVIIIAHWVHFYKAARRETWNVWQLTVIFITPLVYFIPATLLSQTPIVDGRLNYEVLFDSNRTLIYVSVILFSFFTMAQHYLVYEDRKRFIYLYYSAAIVLMAVTYLVDSKALDLGLSIVIFATEMLHHYVIVPLKLP